MNIRAVLAVVVCAVPRTIPRVNNGNLTKTFYRIAENFKWN